MKNPYSPTYQYLYRTLTSASPSPSPIPSMLKQTETTSPYPSTPPRGVKGGYWPSWQVEKFPPSAIPTSYFTHLFYAFAVPDANSFQLLITQTDDQWMGNFTTTLHTKTP